MHRKLFNMKLLCIRKLWNIKVLHFLLFSFYATMGLISCRYVYKFSFETNEFHLNVIIYGGIKIIATIFFIFLIVWKLEKMYIILSYPVWKIPLDFLFIKITNTPRCDKFSLEKHFQDENHRKDNRRHMKYSQPQATESDEPQSNHMIYDNITRVCVHVYLCV